MKIYLTMAEKFPRAQCPKRLPLNFLTGLYIYSFFSMDCNVNVTFYLPKKTISFMYYFLFTRSVVHLLPYGVLPIFI